jgi:hypothetical protein
VEREREREREVKLVELLQWFSNRHAPFLGVVSKIITWNILSSHDTAATFYLCGTRPVQLHLPLSFVFGLRVDRNPPESI